VYRHVPHSDIADALIHIRNLFRRARPSGEHALRAHERREVVIRDLLSNLPRTNQHPTLKTVLEVAENCGLTLDDAHRLFGYDLGKIREYDLRLNGGRTHIFDAYAFERDSMVDLPLRLTGHEEFASDALLRNLVADWQTELPIKVLEDPGWNRPGTFYVHVGTEDSHGSPIPPGAMALVEPIEHDEALRPNPRSIYLLQFGNGYRFSHCVATGRRLRLFSTRGTYFGREEFLYPGEVRIAGRIRMFAMELPAAEHPSLGLLPQSKHSADLVLPWEQPSRDQLFATKYRRFRRSKGQEQFIRDVLKAELHSKLSRRSERRYRRPTSSEPHVNALIHLSIAHMARYTDALHAGRSPLLDQGRFSLETLLKARHIEDLMNRSLSARPPIPAAVWEGLRKEWVEWPSLLSMKFPHLQQWNERILRVTEEHTIPRSDCCFAGSA
jgi:hypothetical protein